MILKDGLGRVHDYLRISLTDKCNLRCFYCMPEEPSFMPSEKIMSADEIAEIARIFVKDLGVKKIRLTGGEPLIRKDFSSLIGSLAELEVKLAITTNGVLLAHYLDQLWDAGLRSLNISLDSLRPERFELISRRDHFRQVMSNVWAAQAKGFKVKLNVVAMREVNDDELVDFVELTRNSAIEVRFIEFMPFHSNNWKWDRVIGYAEILDRVSNVYPVEKLTDEPHSTGKLFAVPGFEGTFAMISTITGPFCTGCNRLRLTADGKLRNCLFSQQEWDILAAFRSGTDIVPLVLEALSAKKPERAGLPEFSDREALMSRLSQRSMVRIGG